MRIRFNEDFVGIYIEALFALKIGAKDVFNQWEQIIKHPSTNLTVLSRSDTTLAQNQGRFLEMLPNNTNRLLLRYGEENKIPTDLAKCTDRAYVLTVLNYSSQVGKFWIASKDVLTAAIVHREELDKLITDLEQ